MCYLIILNYMSNTNQTIPKCPNIFSHYMNERLKGYVNIKPVIVEDHLALRKHC